MANEAGLAKLNRLAALIGRGAMGPTDQSGLTVAQIRAKKREAPIVADELAAAKEKAAAKEAREKADAAKPVTAAAANSTPNNESDPPPGHELSATNEKAKKKDKKDKKSKKKSNDEEDEELMRQLEEAEEIEKQELALQKEKEATRVKEFMNKIAIVSLKKAGFKTQVKIDDKITAEQLMKKVTPKIDANLIKCNWGIGPGADTPLGYCFDPSKPVAIYAHTLKEEEGKILLFIIRDTDKDEPEVEVPFVPRHFGWLSKTGGSNEKFQKRYFTIQDIEDKACICYAESDKKGAKISGSWQIKYSQISIYETGGQPRLEPAYFFGCKELNSDRIYLLESKTEADRKRWIESMEYDGAKLQPALAFRRAFQLPPSGIESYLGKKNKSNVWQSRYIVADSVQNHIFYFETYEKALAKKPSGAIGPLTAASLVQSIEKPDNGQNFCFRIMSDQKPGCRPYFFSCIDDAHRQTWVSRLQSLFDNLASQSKAMAAVDNSVPASETADADDGVLPDSDDDDESSSDDSDHDSKSGKEAIVKSPSKEINEAAIRGSSVSDAPKSAHESSDDDSSDGSNPPPSAPPAPPKLPAKESKVTTPDAPPIAVAVKSKLKEIADEDESSSEGSDDRSNSSSQSDDSDSDVIAPRKKSSEPEVPNPPPVVQTSKGDVSVSANKDDKTEDGIKETKGKANEESAPAAAASEAAVKPKVKKTIIVKKVVKKIVPKAKGDEKDAVKVQAEVVEKPAETMCGNCEKRPQSVSCEKCDEKFCGECDVFLHQSAKKSSHLRIPLN